ncbi:MAG TPA: hypothetical protein VGO22_01100 [Pseudorhizobium sp.]|jgi:hypothetical protein|nr:hypothetical protein [Pseudorhizobium sp.]
MHTIEYCIKPASRPEGLKFIVTRCETEGDAVAIVQLGDDYDTAEAAFEAGTIDCQTEHEALGWPADDERIIYPKPLVMQTGEQLAFVAGVKLPEKDHWRIDRPLRG